MQTGDSKESDQAALPDDEERLQDFFARHGGSGRRAARRSVEPGMRGWSEVYAADGYTLRCDWSRSGSRNELTFSEIPPGQADGTGEMG